LPLLIIDDGKIIKNNLSLIKSKLEDITMFLQQSNAKLKDVEVLTIDGNGRAYLKIKKQKYAIKTFTLKEGIQW
jgi:uncharacterized membrane protein YcaP (DUF421 family)